jgi:hypothetical protein
MRPEGVVVTGTLQTVGSAPPDAVAAEPLAREVDRYGRRDWVANGVLFTLYHLHVTTTWWENHG